MEIEELLEKMKLNNENIKLYQQARNYNELIKYYDESLELDGSMGNQWDVLPQIAYCNIKIGNYNEASEILKKYSLYSAMEEPDRAYRAKMLIALFMQLRENPPHLKGVIKDTLRSWINDPKSSDQTKSIVFDYQDYL